MNIILIGANEIDADSRVVLQDRRSDHIVNVLKSKGGDTVRIGIINGFLGFGVILEIEMKKTFNRIVLEVVAKDSPPERPLLDLILAVPRPIMLKKVFAQAASLGVGRIFLVNAKRVEKSFFGASLLKENNYRKYLLYGLEQSVDTMVPSVSIHRRFRPFVEDELPQIMHDYSACMVAHPEASALHNVNVKAHKGAILVAVGPEGGWLDYEVEKLQEQGFVQVGLGKRILRVDTAVVSLLAQLSYWKQL